MVELLRLGAAGAGVSGAAVWLSSRSRKPEEPRGLTIERNWSPVADPARPELAMVTGAEPRAAVRRALEELGGIRRFVSRGDVVVVKPNMAWDRTPEQAANTNPEIVAETVRLCFEAGAKRVVVGDVAINEPRRVFSRSGIAEAARREGAQVILPEARQFAEVDLRGELLGSWPVFVALVECDKMINIPVAKHHSLTGATLGIKNWYGIIGGPRHRLHQRIHESLADLAAFMRPTVTIIDAWRVLLRNGPSGGNLADVAQKRTVIAGTDPVALDAWAAKAFWDLDENTLRYLALARDRGLGTPRFETLRAATASV
jgi:uncharacterized protein (DUF362 family)